jgi:hypothetical protein
MIILIQGAGIPDVNCHSHGVQKQTEMKMGSGTVMEAALLLCVHYQISVCHQKVGLWWGLRPRLMAWGRLAAAALSGSVLGRHGAGVGWGGTEWEHGVLRRARATWGGAERERGRAARGASKVGRRGAAVRWDGVVLECEEPAGSRGRVERHGVVAGWGSAEIECGGSARSGSEVGLHREVVWLGGTEREWGGTGQSGSRVGCVERELRGAERSRRGCAGWGGAERELVGRC